MASLVAEPDRTRTLSVVWASAASTCAGKASTDAIDRMVANNILTIVLPETETCRAAGLVDPGRSNSGRLRYAADCSAKTPKQDSRELYFLRRCWDGEKDGDVVVVVVVVVARSFDGWPNSDAHGLILLDTGIVDKCRRRGTLLFSCHRNSASKGEVRYLYYYTLP